MTGGKSAAGGPAEIAKIAGIIKQPVTKKATGPTPEEIAAEKARLQQLKLSTARNQRNRTTFAGELGNSGYVQRPKATLLGG